MLATPKNVIYDLIPKTTVQDNLADNITDDDDRIYDETIKHILTPKRQRTTVSTESLAAIHRALNKS